jgi:hypothetical protein
VAAVNNRRRLALLAVYALLTLQFAPAQAQAGGADARTGSLDMVILVDKSLSMASCMGEAKAYLAGKVLGPVLVPGDRLIVETVYGKVERLISIDIKTEDDKARAIRAIGSIKADGRFTDLGAGLDAAKRDLDELGRPERPKYVLLISDERQEAPKGSPYQATDFKLKHPSLEYTKRVDLGKFRAITVGLQVGARVEETAPAVMQLLLEPPSRVAPAAKPAGSPGAAPSGNAAAAGGGARPGNASPTGAAVAAGTAAERALPSWLLYGVAILFVLALAGLLVVLAVAGRRKEKEKTAD